MKTWQIVKPMCIDDQALPLQQIEVPVPVPGDSDLLVNISCCGVCHTEIDEIEGRTLPPTLPVIPGHQVVGIVEAVGHRVTKYAPGDRVGVAWINSACGKCEFCLKGFENLCPEFRATGRDCPGGYAEYMTIDQDFAFSLPEGLSDYHAAPLLCAGAIGYRSLMLAGISDGQSLGFAGFGSSAHLVLLLARHLYPNTSAYVLCRTKAEQELAIKLGARWAGNFDDAPPIRLNAIIDTTPAWTPVTSSLLALNPGGRLVINAIRKESTDQDALLKITFHEHLWMEKEIKSVSNITRHDVESFLLLAARAKIKPVTELYSFDDANRAIRDLKLGRGRASKVLML